MKKTIMFTLLLMACISFAYALDDPAGAILTESNQGRLTETSVNTLTAQGGNVSTLNLDSNMSTLRWQGYVGNVSGNLSLGRGSDVLYNFGNAIIDTVFATTSNTLDWGSLVAATATQIDTIWSFGGAADNATSTFTGTNTIAGISVPTVNLNGGFLSGLFNDGANAAKADFAFGAQIYTAKAGFDGSNYEYGLLVPTATGATETYYFYLSLA